MENKNWFNENTLIVFLLFGQFFAIFFIHLFTELKNRKQKKQEKIRIENTTKNHINNSNEFKGFM